MTHTTAIAPAPLLRLAPGIRREGTAGETLRLGPLRLSDPGPALRAAVTALSDWTRPETLFEVAVRTGGPETGLALRRLLDRCAGAGLLEEAATVGERIGLAIRVWPGTGLGPAIGDTTAAPPYRLIPHFDLRPDPGGWRAASPLAPGEAVITDPSLLATLGAARTGWPPASDEERLAARLLLKAGLLAAQTTDQPRSGLDGPALWLHTRSRRGLAKGPVGVLGADPAAPSALRDPGGTGAPLPLPQPGATSWPAFDTVLDRRASRRPSDADARMTAADLNALLWTAARNTDGPFRRGAEAERLRRPWPAAGGRHESDIFVALSPGFDPLPRFSLYDHANHALRPLAADPAPLLADAATAMGSDAPPQALLILSARYERLTGRYGAASYALMLKTAGAALQTLHLTATALGVASCILGGGNSRLFADLTGLDPLTDGAIGEIALTGRFGPSPTETRHA